VHGRFIVARTCTFQAEALVKTGRTHIETELNNIFAVGQGCTGRIKSGAQSFHFHAQESPVAQICVHGYKFNGSSGCKYIVHCSIIP